MEPDSSRWDTAKRQAATDNLHEEKFQLDTKKKKKIPNEDSDQILKTGCPERFPSLELLEPQLQQRIMQPDTSKMTLL